MHWFKTKTVLQFALSTTFDFLFPFPIFPRFSVTCSWESEKAQWDKQPSHVLTASSSCLVPFKDLILRSASINRSSDGYSRKLPEISVDSTMSGRLLSVVYFEFLTTPLYSQRVILFSSLKSCSWLLFRSNLAILGNFGTFHWFTLFRVNAL